MFSSIPLSLTVSFSHEGLTANVLKPGVKQQQDPVVGPLAMDKSGI